MRIVDYLTVWADFSLLYICIFVNCIFVCLYIRLFVYCIFVVFVAVVRIVRIKRDYYKWQWKRQKQYNQNDWLACQRSKRSVGNFSNSPSLQHTYQWMPRAFWKGIVGQGDHFCERDLFLWRHVRQFNRWRAYKIL